MTDQPYGRFPDHARAARACELLGGSVAVLTPPDDARTGLVSRVTLLADGRLWMTLDDHSPGAGRWVITPEDVAIRISWSGDTHGTFPDPPAAAAALALLGRLVRIGSPGGAACHGFVQVCAVGLEYLGRIRLHAFMRSAGRFGWLVLSPADVQADLRDGEP